MYDDDDLPEIPPVWRRFPEMRPIAQVPALFRVLGTGTAMYGRTEEDGETESFVSSHCLTLLFVPVWAFAAYRVQRSPMGNYFFLGQVPLTIRSWAGNILAFVILAALIAGGTWWAYVGGAEHRGANDLARAEGLIEEGRLAEAAVLLRTVMDARTSKSARAREHLIGLVNRKEGDPKEMAGVYRAAALLAVTGDEVTPELFLRGYELADRASEKSPADALAILDAVADLETGFGAAGQLERRLMEALVKQKPDDVDVVSRWAAVMAAQGKEDECKAALEKMEARLGARAGAAVLGRIRLNEGKYEEAKRLLGPAADALLPAYRQKHQERTAAIQYLYTQLWASVRARTTKDFDFAKYDAADQNAKNEMVGELAEREWRGYPRVRAAINAVERDHLTVQAAVDLGQAELYLAQREEGPAARQAGFTRAERAFLQVREEATRNTSYLLQLGQAYYRMGKPVEGKKAFDDAIKQAKDRKDGQGLVGAVSQMLRDVGAISEARKVLEEAYAAEKDEAVKQRLAFSRSLTSIDLDDRLAWLEKCNQDDFEVKVSALQAKARRARDKGKDEEAEKLLRESLELYKGKDDSGATLNNSALVYFDLYELTHDMAWFKGGVERMEKALEKVPNSAVILRNVASSLLSVVAADVAGASLDWKAMKQRPSTGHLAYLYADEAGRKKLLDKVKAHPALPRIRANLARMLVLAPRQTDVYAQLSHLHGLLHEPDEMGRLLARMAGVDIDTADSVHESREFHAGKKDAKNKEELAHTVRRAREALEACREKKGPTLAAALSRLSGLLIQQDLYAATDADEVVKLAEEAHEAAPSDATRGTLVSALAFRAQGRLKKRDPSFAALARRCERGVGTYLVNWLMVKGGPLREKLLADEDIKRALDEKAAQVKAVPATRGASGWALLKAARPEEAGAVAARVKADPLERDRSAIEIRLMPLNAATVMERVFLLELEGKAGEARKLLRDKAAQGVPLPGAE